MNDLQTNLFLAKASLLDPRLRRQDVAEKADMASAWAEVLADVSPEDAAGAAAAHYARSRDVLMPADVVAFAAQVVQSRLWDEQQQRLEIEVAPLTREQLEQREVLLAELMPDIFGAGRVEIPADMDEWL